MKVAEFGAGVEVVADNEHSDLAVVARFGNPVRVFRGGDAVRDAREWAEFMNFEYSSRD